MPVIGANFGRVGFLAAIPGAELESGLARVFAGEFAVQALPTLEVEIAGTRQVAANDVVVVATRPDGSSSSRTRSAARISARGRATA